MNKKSFILLALFFSKILYSGITTDFSKSNVNLTKTTVKANTTRLMRAAQYSLHYHCSTQVTPLEKKVITQKETEDTLKYVIAIISSDQKKHNGGSRILNPNFLKKNFDFIRWKSDPKKTKQYNITCHYQAQIVKNFSLRKKYASLAMPFLRARGVIKKQKNILMRSIESKRKVNIF
jgi:hypothetical protein